MELIEFEDMDLFPGQCPTSEVELSIPIRITSTLSTEPPLPEAQWRELREYVVEKIMKVHGPFPRGDAAKEAGIFKGFINRWGFDNAMAIAQSAFEAHGGMWFNSPVRIQRFTKASDPYFAQPIAILLGIDA
jgi:hypothetical protein